MNHEKFIYKKIQYIRECSVFYYWYLINKKTREGVHFHGCTHTDENLIFDCNYHGFMTHGLEMHSKKPLYEGQAPVDNCDVTGGDCYCDGTSLGARERLGHINPEDDDAFIWHELECFYQERFEG